MDRRAFLFGTVASLGTALTAVPARADMRRVQLADLRGSLPATDIGLTAGAPDDQSTTLQKAIDKAASEGKPLFLPPGRYEVSNIRLPARLRIIGIEGETRLVYTGGGYLLAGEDATGVTIDGVVFDGANRALSEDAAGLVSFRNVSDLTVGRSEVLGSAGHALSLQQVSGRVSQSKFTGARDAGVWSVDAHGLEISDNTVTDCGDGGILVYRWTVGEDGTIVSRNRVARIAAKSGGTGQNGNGINVFRAGGVILSDNHVSDCAFSAIRANSASNVQIATNQCLRSGETAIYSEFAFEGAMIANNVVDTAAVGISIANFNEGGRLANVSGNIVRNLHKGGPYKDESGLDFGVGIYVEADTTVSANVIDTAATLGLQLGWGPYMRNVIASGNMIRKAGTGIGVSVVEGVGQTMISGNLIADVQAGGIRGMRWADFATDELVEAASGAYPGLILDKNSLS
ncbi:TIGR03808 family TAT-translocated repetitive protein [Oryzibacter oryziterrae]|uniref:TIGR03808 family TAT-translocated repetitive protein n=1 Tax=Oryzibacter oryziterrae TaxID=2766474 RepID=UPI001F17F8C8|nr:TIGR03808 family TAT-translocated repetitive protein [Oryzibacter oryziterrae]